MENLSRRKFIITSALLSASPLFAKNSSKVHIDLMKKPFEYHVKKGKLPGKRVLIIGGIHGNEIGAYKASDLLVDCDIKRGELIIIPRSNFTSILAKMRGYNGDMNRKFAHIDKKDPDRYFVELLKSAILEFRPDVVISMHDGYGFARKNPNHWGQSIVIDENVYKNFHLYEEASSILKDANPHFAHYKLGLLNTRTFTSSRHKEQRNALTGWCLQHDIKAYCIEASKQLRLDQKIYTHLVMLREFFKRYKIELAPSIDQLIHDETLWNHHKTPTVTLKINGSIHKFSKSSTIKIPKGSNIEVIAIDGNRGSYLIGKHINLNWQSFCFSKPQQFLLKEDYKTRMRLTVCPV
ncbi:MULTISPECIES: M14/M99 family metallopeptidase [unclassified Nitratiruptor]|uniref:M14/M99 family metallopeptidase n=1 Tax=unclassified Nitratiruptor TaxID=2624044 RepID=UPI0019158108|nr:MULTISPECIES: M14/M99 family metallopeptidase [unclassified Nitratiruptor]BCD59863.1 hypothetical protein NitYY0810_C0622 [Nitratiruptor sp. YY08-10]BCD63786.1 hypothetical protein NitYY0814_C0621 [Nitratiruptor sp. YY08-14]